MLYNNYDLKTRDEEGVSDIVPGIEHEKEYYVYSCIARKIKKEVVIVYDVSPRPATALIRETNNKKVLIAMHAQKGKRFSMFSAYGRQVYFADTPEEAEIAYFKLCRKVQKQLTSW